MWPSQIPSGIANAVAIRVATSASWIWVQVSSSISPEPAHTHGAGLRLAFVEDELDRVPEGPEHGEDHRLTARSHGVAARWMRSTASSSTVASSDHQQ